MDKSANMNIYLLSRGDEVKTKIWYSWIWVHG